MQLDGNEISEDTLRRVQALRDLFERAAEIWAKVPGAEQNAINDLQSDYPLGQCVYWGREAAQGAQERLVRERLFDADGPNRAHSTTLALTSEAGTPLLARLIMPGDGYGAWNQETRQWVRTHGLGQRMDEAAPPMVEFFDRRFAHTPFGQFTGHRFYVSTLLARHGHGGELPQQDGVQGWHIDANTRQQVELWLREHPLLRVLQEQQTLARPHRERG